MRFLVDEQLPPALARWLISAEHEADHVSWRGLARAPDDAIWSEAVRIGAVIVSKDDDFARKRALADTGPQIIWVRVGNVRTAPLLQAFASAFPRIIESLARGESLIEWL